MYLCTFILIVIDFLSGLIQALKNHCYRSSHMRDGLYRKMGSLIMLALAWVFNYAQTTGILNFGIPVAQAVSLYICVMEVGSIIENLGSINKNIVPGFIKKYFEKLKEEIEHED